MVSLIMNKTNGVKGMPCDGGDSLPDRVFLTQQVDPDRQSVTESNKEMLKLATLNVRTLYQKGKLINEQREQKCLKIDILGTK